METAWCPFGPTGFYYGGRIGRSQDHMVIPVLDGKIVVVDFFEVRADLIDAVIRRRG